MLEKRSKRPIMIIGKDTRVSGDMLENALTAGILAVGGNVIKGGVLPTPAIAFLTQHYGADAGIVISASHNSFEYNGIKFFNGDGYKLDDLLEEKIEDLILSSVDVNSHITGDLVGKRLEAEEDARSAVRTASARNGELQAGRQEDRPRLRQRRRVSGRAAASTANWARRSSCISDRAERRQHQRRTCGSTHPERMAAKVRELQARIFGLAFDGDADRLIVCDNLGRIVDGDKTIAICARMLKRAGTPRREQGDGDRDEQYRFP